MATRIAAAILLAIAGYKREDKLMGWNRDTDSGEISYICDDCGNIYYWNSDWDMANLESHEHN